MPSVSEEPRELPTSDSTPLLRRGDPARLLSVDEQEEYLLMLARGASPAAACTKLNIALPVVAATMDADGEFAALLHRVNELLSQNVAAALYRSAMEGSVSAQTFYLKNRPPPEWPDAASPSATSTLDELTDDELIAQFRQEATSLLARLEQDDSPSRGAESSQ